MTEDVLDPTTDAPQETSDALELVPVDDPSFTPVDDQGDPTLCKSCAASTAVLDKGLCDFCKPPVDLPPLEELETDHADD